jgi:O-antigen chain-terminating methyltransferase
VFEARDEVRRAAVASQRAADDTREIRMFLAEHEAAMALDTRLARLSALVASVEPYQPIYGQPELVPAPRRVSRDRADRIAMALGDRVDGLRVLDLGCSFGYMSFYLAERGAETEGWDIDPATSEIARLTQEINGLRARFVVRELTPASAARIDPDQFDVVLLLSLLHHVVHFQGLEAARDIVKTLLQRAPILILEMGRAGEDPDLVWNGSQPADSLSVLEGLEVQIEELGAFPTHLSPVPRILLKVTRRHVEVAGRRYAVDEPAFEAYRGSPVRRTPFRRRYYRGPGHFVKEYVIDARDRRENERQIVNELALLMRFERWSDDRFPQLVDYCIERGRAVIVTKLVDGRLLDEDRPAARAYGVDRLAREILESLAVLEAHGLFHNDLRSWNVMLGSAVRLIDFGICDPVAKENGAVALLCLLRSVITGTREQSGPPLMPERAAFAPHPYSLAIFDAVASGETSPAALLKLPLPDTGGSAAPPSPRAHPVEPSAA